MQYLGNQSGEVFVGNVPTASGIPDYLSGLKSVRLGAVALDINGDPLDPQYMLPMFVHRSEYLEWDRIMVTQGRRWNYLKE